MVIACADSRGMISDDRPGQPFVLRNVVALVLPYAPSGACHGTSAALEFGVRVPRVRHLIVMGRGLCGGIRGLVHGVPPGPSDFAARWTGIATPMRAVALFLVKT